MAGNIRENGFKIRGKGWGSMCGVVEMSLEGYGRMMGS